MKSQRSRRKKFYDLKFLKVIDQFLKLTNGRLKKRQQFNQLFSYQTSYMYSMIGWRKIEIFILADFDQYKIIFSKQ